MTAKTHFQRYVWCIKEYAAALAWPGMLAIAIALTAVLVAGVLLRPLSGQMSGLQQRVAQAKAAHGGRLMQLPAADGAIEQLRQYYQFFPAKETLGVWMGRLYETAAENGIALDQGQYQLSHDGKGKLWRYEIVLPVHGSYPQVRAFLAQVLAKIPHLALQSVSFERQKVGDAMVEANIRLTLYLSENNA
ncbi:hypothetical protein [Janthinobacterium sp. 1_2014MBL_MicDiv]|uniref:hypothetical protein n=1 Tax=Janthinobacterium sp. 1_2014MBL_MicDiv TaxID=1644131 RepID=UPI0008F4848B|nr:hypothetical protein [Janthinobacterium sp. 1_2014MBL_MicDiv]